ncbi:NucA/NucB deoxyribonuclease domain-containing protein [Leifsonia sp. NPDC102414]|uniref:NucA/NucB deoxyribonuclease domain-containing protein n=1 Tax=Leifsonia sp. NPDC102414 TaxID=3364124 RepID=UPI0038190608
MNSISRTTSGGISYNITGSYARVAASGNVCAAYFQNCALILEAKYAADDTVHTIGSANLYSTNGTGSNQFSMTTSLPKISAVRTRVTVGRTDTADLVSDWVPVADPWEPPSVGVSVNSISRTTNGSISFDLTGTYSHLMEAGGVCSAVWSYCVMYFDARYAGDGSVHSLGSKDLYSGTGTGSAQFTSVTSLPQVAAVRTRITGGGGPDLVTDWISVADGWAPPSVGLAIDSMSRNSSGTLLYSITASYARLMEYGGVCSAVWSFCVVYLDARYSGDGTVHSLASKDVYGGPGTGTAQFSTPTSASITAVRARVSGGGGPDLASAWVPVSENIQGGHDLDSALSMALAAISGMEPMEACITLFPVGSHQQGSSVNDQQLACLEATNEGKTVAQFLSPYLRTLSARQITNMLVAAGIAQASSTQAANPSLDIDYDLPLPSGCSWVDLHNVVCSTSSGTVQIAPKSAPPRQDPVWESNVEGRAQQNPTPPDPADDPPPATSPISGASPGDIDVIRQETCEQYLAAYQDAAGVSDDACDKSPIFFTGSSSPEGTKHDREAIAANPSWFKLTYASAAEKAAAGKTRNSSWYGAPGCPAPEAGMQCDEYPYFATNEGYPDGAPSLKMIPSADNAAQGGKYSAFVKQCFASVPPTDQAGRKFLVVPLPPGIPTAPPVCARP